MKIRNERQYRIATSQRKQLSDALDELLSGELAASTEDPFPDQAALRRQLVETSLISQVADLDAQLQEYEALRAGQFDAVVAHSFVDLPDALVRARIASGAARRYRPRSQPPAQERSNKEGNHASRACRRSR